MFTRICIETHLSLVCPHLFILFKSLLSSVTEVFTLCTAEINKASSASNTALDNSSAMSSVYIKISKSQSIEPGGTPVLTLVDVETCLFKTTLCFLFLKKSHDKFKSSPDMSFCFNLKVIPFCHTLLNAFDVSRKTLNINSIIK